MVWLRVFSKVLPIIFLLLMGFFIKKSRFFSEQTVAEIKKFVVNISLPALLFTAFLNTDFKPKYLWIVLIVFSVNFIMLFMGKTAAKVFKIDNAYYPLLFTGFETGMLGFSLFGTVYGMHNAGVLGIIDLGQELFVWFCLVALLTVLNGGSHDFRKLAVSFGTSPVIIGIIFGVILNITGISLSLSKNVYLAGFLTTITMLSQLTIPLILIVIGSQLTFRFNDFKLPMKTLAVRYILLIVLAFIINIFIFRDLLHLPRIFATGLFVMFILPPPFIMPLFMNDHDEASLTYVNNTLSLATILSILIFTITAFIVTP